DEAQIHAWWEQWPEANVATRTGEVSGFDVLDIDPRHQGDESLSRLESEIGAFPLTLKVQTGGGGFHLCFQQVDGVRSLNGFLGDDYPGLDCKADGGYVLAPPSFTAGPYMWADSPTAPLATWPEAMLPRLPRAERTTSSSSTSSDSSTTNAGKIKKGRRNEVLFKLTTAMIRHRASEEAILTALRVHNAENCDPPLADDELRKMIRDAVKRYAYRHVASDDADAFDENDTPILIDFKDIQARDVEWLWDHKIARGALTVLASDPGLGKSTMLCDLAARMSRHDAWPDKGRAPLGNVMFLSAEDN